MFWFLVFCFTDNRGFWFSYALIPKIITNFYESASFWSYHGGESIFHMKFVLFSMFLNIEHRNVLGASTKNIYIQLHKLQA